MNPNGLFRTLVRVCVCVRLSSFQSKEQDMTIKIWRHSCLRLTVVAAVITDHKMREQRVNGCIAAATHPLCLSASLVPFHSSNLRFSIYLFILSCSHLHPSLDSPSPCLFLSLLLVLLFTLAHTLPHTPVSNLYEMIPNAFGSQWEFPL